LGDWGYDGFSSTSQASPNDTGIVIVIVVVGEGQFGLHGGNYSTRGKIVIREF